MKTSLRAKLSGLIALLAVVIVCGVTWALMAARGRDGRDELQRKALLYGKLLAKQLEPAVAFGDRQTARQVFVALRLDSDVTSAALYGAQGQALAELGGGAGAAPPWAEAAIVRVEPGFLEVTAPVVSSEGPKGIVRMRLSTARLVAQEAAAYRAAGGAALGAMLVALGFAWLIAGTVARRLRRIAHAAARAAQGDLSQAEVAPGAPDEIGRLTGAFNAMLRHQRALVSKLTHAAATEQQRLSQLVEERTERLNLRNLELEEGREQYRLIAESTSAIPWEYAVEDHRFSYVGPQAAKLLGYPAREWTVPGFLSRIMVDEDRARVEAERDAGIAAGHDFELEMRVKSATGAIVAVRCVACPAGGYLRGLFLDVTARKKLEGELAQAQKLESIWRLAAGVAHEINTPVQYVTDSLHFLRDGWADALKLIDAYQALRISVAHGVGTPAQAAELEAREAQLDLPYLVEHMGKAGESAAEGLLRVSEIVRSMKAFAHPDAKVPVPYDLNAGVTSAVTISRGEYKYVADVETALGVVPDVLIVPGEINQVLLNLIINAAHAIEAAHRPERGMIRIATALEGDQVVLRVSDNGCGIPDTIKQKVFDQFFTTKAVGKGTGQGLSISRQIVLRHKGEMTFESKAGEGTTFIIRLPSGLHVELPVAHTEARAE